MIKASYRIEPFCTGDVAFAIAPSIEQVSLEWELV